MLRPTLTPARILLASLLALSGCDTRTDAPTTAPDSAQASTTPESEPTLAIDVDRMMGHVEHLAKDDLRGRYTLAPGLKQAADYIAGELKEAGVSPVGSDYLATFPLTTGARADGKQQLVVTSKGKDRAVAADAFTPLSVSSSGSVEGEVVFVGYAARSEVEEEEGTADTNAPTAGADAEPEYDDLAGVDLKGKIALVFMDAPGMPDLRAMFAELQSIAENFEKDAKELREKKDEKGMRKLHVAVRKRVGAIVEPFMRGEKLEKDFFEAPEDPLEADFNLMQVMRPVMQKAQSLPGPRFGQRTGSMRAKVERLREAGAVGVIAVRGPRSFVIPEDRTSDKLEDLADAGISRGSKGELPVVQLQWKEADKLFRVQGKKLSQIQKTIDLKYEPRSGPVGVDARLETKIAPITQDIPNVLSTIPGTDLAHEIVLVGAHYDHIGDAETGRCNTVTDDGGEPDSICNGADDNASGSAMVLELARAIKASGIEPRRTLVFAHFAGEELGLHGSAALAENPPDAGPFRGGKVVAMVNLDMVGRLGPKGLAIGGLSSSSAWMPMLDEIGNHGMKILYERSIASRSDQANFYKKKIPVLFFFTNVHLDYHRATDHFDKIDRDGMSRIGDMVGEVMLRLAGGTPIPYTEPKNPDEGLNQALPGQTKGTVEKKVKADGTVM